MLELRGVWKRYAGIPVVEDVRRRLNELLYLLGLHGDRYASISELFEGHGSRIKVLLQP